MSETNYGKPPVSSPTHTFIDYKLKPEDREVICHIDGIISSYNLIKLQDELKKIRGYRFILKCVVIAE